MTYVEEAKTTLDPETQPAEFARATMIEARFHHYHGQSGKAAELLLQAREPAERSGDIVLLNWIYAYLAGAYQHLIDFEESNRWTQKNVDLGEAHDSPHIGSMGYEYLMENAFMRGYWRRVPRARRPPPRAGREGALLRPPGVELPSVSPTPTTASATWPWPRPPATTASRSPTASATSAWPLSSRAGRRWSPPSRAASTRPYPSPTRPSNGRTPSASSKASSNSRRARACIAQLQGDHEAVLGYTNQAEKLLEGTDEFLQPVWVSPTRCQSLIATGQLDEAEQRLETTLEAARRADMPHWEAMALKVRGQLNAARGDEEAARKDFDATIEIFEKFESRLELGRTLVLRAGDEDLLRARELFQSCGATGDLANFD